MARATLIRAGALAIGLALAASLGGCAGTTRGISVAESMGIATGFINKTVVADGASRAFVVYVPRDYDPAKAWPLIVFLHGAGERGDDGLKQTEVGIGRAVRLDPERWPAIIVLPQCPEGVWWDKAIHEVDKAVEQTLAEYNIDRKRMYLTGISMGGYATWVYGAQQADRFAALMPICGGGYPEDAKALASIPIWAFHGAKDEVVLPRESQKMVEAVKEAGGTVTYTEFEDADHNSWDAAYADQKAIRWLFRQSR